MSRKENGDPDAVALINKRWAKASPEERSEEGRRLARARWEKKRKRAKKAGKRSDPQKPPQPA